MAKKKKRTKKAGDSKPPSTPPKVAAASASPNRPFYSDATPPGTEAYLLAQLNTGKPFLAIGRTAVPKNQIPDDLNKLVIMDSFIVSVTPELAKEMLRHLNTGNRNLRGGWVDDLEKLFLHKLVRSDASVVITVEPNGMSNLANGQHILTLVVHSGETINMEFKIVAMRDDIQRRRLFANYDGIKVRSQTDVHKIYNTSRCVGLSGKHWKSFMEAQTQLVTGFNRSGGGQFANQNKAVKVVTCLHYAPFAKEYFNAISACTDVDLKAVLMKAHVVAVGIVTFKYQPELAERFWTEVSTLYNTRAHVASATGWALKQMHEKLTSSDSRRALLCYVAAEGWNKFFEEEDAAHLWQVDRWAFWKSYYEPEEGRKVRAEPIRIEGCFDRDVPTRVQEMAGAIPKKEKVYDGKIFFRPWDGVTYSGDYLDNLP